MFKPTARLSSTIERKCSVGEGRLLLYNSRKGCSLAMVTIIGSLKLKTKNLTNSGAQEASVRGTA